MAFFLSREWMFSNILRAIWKYTYFNAWSSYFMFWNFSTNLSNTNEKISYLFSSILLKSLINPVHFSESSFISVNKSKILKKSFMAIDTLSISSFTTSSYLKPKPSTTHTPYKVWKNWFFVFSKVLRRRRLPASIILCSRL